MYRRPGSLPDPLWRCQYRQSRNEQLCLTDFTVYTYLIIEMEIGARLIYVNDTDAKKPKVQRPRSFLTCTWQPKNCARYTSVLACASAGLGFRIVRIAETPIRFAPTEETSRSARVSAIPDGPAPPPWGGRSPPYPPAGGGSARGALWFLARRGYLHPGPTTLSLLTRPARRQI